MKSTTQKVTVITFSDRAPLVIRGGKRAALAKLDDYLAARVEAIHVSLPVSE